MIGFLLFPYSITEGNGFVKRGLTGAWVRERIIKAKTHPNKVFPPDRKKGAPFRPKSKRKSTSFEVLFQI